mmetsp:Transcript_15600/g.10969  ORF Transcript_15600/g.10969 Transcript_15600/m.10969 type:complete len:98 (+) Transcript_15600:453-746(+)|eukprot:CAMPEP_0116879976 /NCGR_PEP_ID=MMETSP0463-20121206/11827_1 /TAXON_ID=181622 /ORGANISM="Strombidinopsis sp, Strain SopsisLIS2011" /LENGTH=97 /DNA_ID=CAMNT_0004529937 /DNA_START=383 /DNA_END=676 /DNA_ORIENTATION=-
MTVKVWDQRVRNYIQSYKLGYQITSVVISNDASHLYCAGVDDSIKSICLRQNQIDMSLLGHTDTITGISKSHSGNYLLSNSMDKTLKMWDIRPYVVE